MVQKFSNNLNEDMLEKTDSKNWNTHPATLCHQTKIVVFDDC